MPNMFLDPRRPLTTCTATNCEGCPVSKDVHCHFKARAEFFKRNPTIARAWGKAAN